MNSIQSSLPPGEGASKAGLSFSELSPAPISAHPLPRLPKHTLEMLQHLADGKGIKDAAMLEGVTWQSAKNILRRAREIYDVKNTYHLLATALRRGLID